MCMQQVVLKSIIKKSHPDKKHPQYHPKTVLCQVLVAPAVVLGMLHMHLQTSSHEGSEHGVCVTDGGWLTNGSSSRSRQVPFLLINGRPVLPRQMIQLEAGAAAAAYTVAFRCAQANSTAYSATDAAHAVERACEAAEDAVDQHAAAVLAELVLTEVGHALSSAPAEMAYPAELASTEDED